MNVLFLGPVNSAPVEQDDLPSASYRPYSEVALRRGLRFLQVEQEAMGPGGRFCRTYVDRDALERDHQRDMHAMGTAADLAAVRRDLDDGVDTARLPSYRRHVMREVAFIGIPRAEWPT